MFGVGSTENGGPETEGPDCTGIAYYWLKFWGEEADPEGLAGEGREWGSPGTGLERGLGPLPRKK